MADPRPPIAVLVDREGLGDVLLKRPFLKALREAYREHEVWWIATHQTAMEDELRQLVGGDVAKVLARAALDGPVLPMIRRLRALPPFERVFDTRTKIATVALTRVSLRHRGFYCGLPGYILSDGRPPSGRRRPPHIAARMIAMIECATGRPAPPPEPLTPSARAEAAARSALPDGRIYIGLAPGSRVTAKNWPFERYCEVARGLIQQQLAPVFFLGPMEQVSDGEVEAGAPGARIIRADASSPAAAGLDLLVAHGRRLAAVVANDNGVGHLMGAAGAPVVSLFGPTRPQRWAPVAPKNIVLWSRDFGADEITAIPAALVVAATLAALGQGAAPERARIGRLGRLGRF